MWLNYITVIFVSGAIGAGIVLLAEFIYYFIKHLWLAGKIIIK